MADAATVRATTRKLQAQGDLHGCTGLADVAERYIGHVQDVMSRRTCGPRAEAAMHEAVGDLAATGGWCCFDAGDFLRARHFYETALTSADLAGSRVLKARALALLSRLGVEVGRGGEAVTMARRALEVTQHGGSPARSCTAAWHSPTRLRAVRASRAPSSPGRAGQGVPRAALAGILRPAEILAWPPCRATCSATCRQAELPGGSPLLRGHLVQRNQLGGPRLAKIQLDAAT
jgi:hypothetical protein